MATKYSKAQSSKIRKVMHEYKTGTLHSGKNPRGPKKARTVKSRKQAIAIALSEAGVRRRKSRK